MARGTRLHTRNPLKLEAAGDLYIGGVSMTKTATELNSVVIGVAGGSKIASGNSASIDGSLEIATGLTTVTNVVVGWGASIDVGGSAAYYAVGKLAATAGSIVIWVFKEDGTTPGDASVEVNWIAFGT